MTTKAAVTGSELTSAVAGVVGNSNPTAVLALVAVAQFMVILDASVVNVAIPKPPTRAARE